jgi:hypothetical protein
MIELRSAEQLKKATERARAGNLFVQTTSIYRQYRVTNRETGAEYVVNFFVRAGRRYGHCNCKAGAYNLACKHLSAAAGLHMMIAAARADSPNSPERRAA